MFHPGVSLGEQQPRREPHVSLILHLHGDTATALIQAEAQLRSVEMEEQRLQDKRAAGKSSEARVDVQSEHLDSAHTDAGPLIQDRDPTGINQSLKVTFEDVIAEPPSVRSLDSVWLWSHALFEVSRLWCYRLLCVLLALPLSLAAGLLFAALGCLHVWLITPGVRLLRISTLWVRTVWGGMLSVLLSPVFSSAGEGCGQIHLYLAKDEQRC